MSSHEANKEKVCILCLKKSKVLTSLSENVREIISRRYYHDVISRSAAYPSRICTNCRLRWCTKDPEKGNPDGVFPHKYIDYGSDEKGLKCKCDICMAARLTYGSKQSSNLPHVAAKVNQGRPKLIEKPVSKSLRVCNLCLTEIGRGKRHNCTSTSRTGNLASLMADENSPPKAAEAAVARFMGGKALESDSGAIRLSNRRGKPAFYTKVEANSSQPNKNVVSSKSLFALKTQNGLSLRRTLGVMKGLKKSGVKFEPGSAQKLAQFNSQLTDLYNVVKFGALTEDYHNAHADLPVVYCTDVQKLINRVKEERSTVGVDLLIKLGIDGGGGSFKITLSLLPKDQTQEQTERGEFKQGGVKQLFILVLVPDLPEKYHYVDVLWRKLLKLDQLDAVVACDLKMTNIMVGIMAHSSSNPCPYCEVEKRRLSTEEGILRSIANIRQNLTKQKIDRACCINDPLIPGNPEQPIFLSIPPPPLHITLGIVNTVFKAVEKIAPDWCDLWVNRANVRHLQRTYGFTGGACRRLIENRAVLNDNAELAGYVKVLSNFKDVEDKCFKISLKPDFAEAIQAFSESWLGQNLPGTSKFHILRFHVVQFCLATGRGLGLYNEQASESVHYDFNQTWERYKTVKTAEVYQANVLRAVIDYNSSHLQ